ncbi:MAG TPA: polysaccharide deacetylase family protein [Thermodesulfobacteriota bacterium]|nr:polysaccharide deacetylase family protein [Thermodesulfobacteriota bacterium]
MAVKIPILMYHQISDDVHPRYRDYTATVKAFRAQMKVLKLLNYESISFDKLLECKEGKAKLPRKPIIITFDDALEDAIDNSVPILKDFGFTAMYYVTTGYVGTRSNWMIPEVNIVFQVAPWPKIKNLCSMGFELGSHSVTHPHLNEVTAEECLREMTESRRTLEETLGREVRHMAYPHGAFNKTVRGLAYTSGYYTATTCEPTFAKLTGDLLSLPRFNIGMEDTLIDFISKLYIAKAPTATLRYYNGVLRKNIPAPVRKFLRKYIFKRKVTTPDV